MLRVCSTALALAKTKKESTRGFEKKVVIKLMSCTHEGNAKVFSNTLLLSESIFLMKLPCLEIAYCKLFCNMIST